MAAPQRCHRSGGTESAAGRVVQLCGDELMIAVVVASNDQNPTVGQQGGGVVTPRGCHRARRTPRARLWVVQLRRLVGGASSEEDPAIPHEGRRRNVSRGGE